MSSEGESCRDVAANKHLRMGGGKAVPTHKALKLCDA